MCAQWKTYWKSTSAHTKEMKCWCVWMRQASSSSRRRERRVRGSVNVREYERNGVSSLFMLFAPLAGWRRVEVRERRTKVDWAHVIKRLVDEDCAERDRIVLVMDNLNTHRLS